MNKYIDTYASGLGRICIGLSFLIGGVGMLLGGFSNFIDPKHPNWSNFFADIAGVESEEVLQLVKAMHRLCQ